MEDLKEFLTGNGVDAEKVLAYCNVFLFEYPKAEKPEEYHYLECLSEAVMWIRNLLVNGIPEEDPELMNDNLTYLRILMERLERFDIPEAHKISDSLE